MPTAIEKNALYKIDEAAEYLRCGKSNVYELVNSQELVVVCVGAGKKGYRVKGSDLLAFVESRRQGADEAAGARKFLKAFQ